MISPSFLGRCRITLGRAGSCRAVVRLSFSSGVRRTERGGGQEHKNRAPAGPQPIGLNDLYLLRGRRQKVTPQARSASTRIAGEQWCTCAAPIKSDVSFLVILT